MTNRETLKGWINESLLNMPVNQEDFFKQLWKNGKINYESETELIDEIDEISSQLACTAFEKNIGTLLVLPDQSSHRGAVTFATILVKYAVQCILNNSTPKKILYFGNNLQFKHAIQSTYIGNLPLSQAFSYIQAKGKFNRIVDDRKALIPSQYLPEVICVYNPIDAEEYINRYKPKFVAIDCGRENKIEWFSNLIAYCRKKTIPIISWSSNFYGSFGKSVEDSGGSIFYFPSKNGSDIKITDLFLDNGLYNIQPLILIGNHVNFVDKEIYLAKECLKKLKIKSKGKLQDDSLILAWKNVKAIENLVVPITLFNAEAKSFWGIHSLTDLQSAIQKYIDQILKSDSIFAEGLNEYVSHSEAITESFKTNEPPLWTALSNYCVDNIQENGINVIIFPKKYQKQLFVYTLLSKSNISEDELLKEWKSVLITLKDYSQFKKENRSTIIFPLLVGLPGAYEKEYFYDLLADSVKILLYPNQLSILKYLVNEVNVLEKEHLKKSIKTLKRISGLSNDVNLPAKVDRFYLSKDYIQQKIDRQAVKLSTIETASLLNIGDLDSELSALFDRAGIDSLSENEETHISATTHSQQDIFIQNALEINFIEGYKILVSQNDKLNVINDLKEGVYSRAIKVGDRILVILNQARQSLFDLVLSRVHSHPSLEIHFAVLRKWSEELHLGYIIWQEQNKNKGIDDVLKLLQEKGSSITTRIAVNNWVTGITLRPQDEKDIMRIGEILKSKFIIDNYRRIFAAAARIVGIHITLARKLNDWITKQGYQNDKHDSELIDEEVGLTLGDVKSSFRIFTVQNIKKVERQILENSLGVLEKI